jgi:hypothetical protein
VAECAARWYQDTLKVRLDIKAAAEVHDARARTQ